MSNWIDSIAVSEFADAMLPLLTQAGWKAAGLLLAASLASLSLRRAAAATRHLVWALAVLAVLLLPLFQWMAPELELATPRSVTSARGIPEALVRAEAVAEFVAVDSYEPLQMGGALSVEPIEAEVPLSKSVWILMIWAAGVCVVLLRLALQALKLRALSRSAREVEDALWLSQFEDIASQMGIRQTVRLLRGPVSTPLTWGIFRSFVLLPEASRAWDAERRRHVLLHELAHVRRHDCLSQLAAQFACALHWFNPLSWIASGRMLMEREKACDDRVLESGVKPTAYANDLVEIATTHSYEPAPAMAKRPMLSQRVVALLDERQRRQSPGRRAIVAMASFALATMTLLSAISFAAPSPDPEPQSTRQDGQRAEAPSDARAAIDAANESFAEAFEDWDVDAMLEHYTDDAEVYPAIGRPVRGHRALARHYDDLFETGLMYDARTVTEDLQVHGDEAFETGRFTVYGYSGERVSAGNYISFWRNEGGVWKVYREMITVSSQSPSSDDNHRYSNGHRAGL